MKKITLCILLVFALPVHSQNFQWLEIPNVDFTLNPEGIGYPMAVDNTGNVYLSGFKDTPFIYDSIYGNVFLNKYDTNGQQLFTKTISGKVTVYDMVADTSGNIIVSAGWLESAAFGTMNLSSNHQEVQPLTMKFDGAGNLLWYFQPPVDQNGIAAFSETIATDLTNNVYVGYNADISSYIAKLSPDGSLLMTIAQENTRNVTSVSVDNAGNIYAAGSCSDINSHYAGVAVPALTGYNTYVVKYSPAGVYQWLRYVEDVTCPGPKVAARTPDAVYFSSYLFGAFDFGAIHAEGPTGSLNTDFFITKLNATGTFQWMREVPGEGYAVPGNRNFLSVDANDNVYFGGRASGTTDWGNGFTTSIDGFSNNDVIVLKYDSSGALQLVKTAGGESEDRVDGIGTDSVGNIFVSGMAAANSNFGDFSHNAGDFQSYPFLTKIGSGLLNTPQNDSPKPVLYPNPANDHFYVSGIDGLIQGSIFNPLGQKVMDFALENNDPINIGRLAKGCYVVKIDRIGAVKLIKE